MTSRYRNVGGPHKRRDGSWVKQREVFRPTERELDSFGDKFEPVEAPAPMPGADIGLRSLEWGHPAALKKALDAGLTVEEMETAGPTGATGFVSADVERAVEARD